MKPTNFCKAHDAAHTDPDKALNNKSLKISQ